jgi:hypothetical protein
MNETAKKMIINNIAEKCIIEKINVWDSIKLAFEKGYECGKGENNN